MIVEVLEKVEERLYSIEEYFEVEEKSNTKHEFRNGKIVAMPGGTKNHTTILENVFYTLKTSVNKKNYKVNGSEQTVFIPSFNQVLYPDACVTAKPRLFADNQRAILNPTLIVEVLSDSSWRYDRGEKFRKYETLASLQEYVLIEQDIPIVDVYFKSDKGWHFKSYRGLEESVQLKSINCELKMADIYEEVEDLKPPQLNMDLG